ncbi:ABC transporter substrate-binding protein [Serinicoccus kebangsaanensis]|uniref:ABC transporter substrate-binding protein n=1 Tax=Serinicoccus kebangsaanensis TaxID=2602069 RepID=UPI00124E4F48|nr:sugar ABC transporter substrate-binding protein [Serinicoccus kebangsaanensis]
MRSSHPSRTLVLLAGSTLLLSACAQGSATNPQADEPSTDTEAAADDTADEAAQEMVQITYSNFSANGGNEENLDAIVTAFEEENPSVDVTVETLPYDDYFTALQTAVAGGSEADVFELNYENFVTYQESGALAAMEGVDTSAYVPSLVEAFAVDGTSYGLPESFSNVVLFYNADLFEEAGVEPPTSDWTWQDERAAAEQLTDAGAGVWGDYQPISFHEFYKALAQNGGTFLSEDGSAVAFDSPEGVEAAEWLVGKSGTTMPSAEDGAGTPDFDSGLFMDGELAMWHTGIWMFGAMAEADFAWDIVVEPGMQAQASAMFANTVVVSERSEQQEAAQAFAAYVTGSDVAAQTRIEAGWELPPVDDESLNAAYLEQTPPANRAAVFEALDEVVLPPVIASQQEMQDIVTEELTEAAAGRKTAQEAVDSAAERVAPLLGE